MDLLVFTLKVFGAINVPCLIALLLIAKFSVGTHPDDLSDTSEGR